MKKLIRKLFNRTMLVIFILLVEIAAIVAAFIIGGKFASDGEWGQKYPNLVWIGIVDELIILFLFILQIIIFFRVLYRQMDAEFKIPWIIILLALPLVGPLLYVVLARRNLKRKIHAY